MAGNLLCIGHRGAMGHAPENTLASFQAALMLGAPCVEFDLRRVDGELLVFHDDRLERTTNGTGRLHEHSVAHLRGLDAGHGQKIPTLHELCDFIDRRAGVNIELKDGDCAEPVAAALQRLRQAGWDEHLLLVSSFDHAQLHRLRELDGRIKLALLFDRGTAGALPALMAMRPYAINIALPMATTSWLAATRRQQLRMFVYTVNTPGQIADMRSLGVDGVFSDFPDRVIQGNVQRMPIGWP